MNKARLRRLTLPPVLGGRLCVTPKPHHRGDSLLHQVRRWVFARGASYLLLTLIIQAALCGCHSQGPIRPHYPSNHSPVIDSLIAIPDSIGPTD